MKSASSTTAADTDEDTPPSSTSTNGDNDTNFPTDNHLSPDDDDDDDENSTTLTAALQILYIRHQLKRSLTLSEMETLRTAVHLFPKWIVYGFLECSVDSHGGVEMLDVQQVVQLSEEMMSMMGYGADGVKAGKATSGALLYYMWLRVKSMVGDDEDDEGEQIVKIAERGGFRDGAEMFQKCRDLTSGEDGLKVTRMMGTDFDEDDEDPDKTPRPKPKMRRNIKHASSLGEDKELETPTTPTSRRKPRDGEMIKKPRKSADMPYLSPSSPLRQRITRVSRPDNQQHQRPRATDLTTRRSTPTGNSPDQGLQFSSDHSNCTTCTTPKLAPSTGFRILRAFTFIIFSSLILLIGAAIPPLLVGYYSKNPKELAALRDTLKWIADFGNSVWSAGWNDGLGGVKEAVLRGAKVVEKTERVDLGKWERWRLWVGGILERGRRSGGTG